MVLTRALEHRLEQLQQRLAEVQRRAQLLVQEGRGYVQQFPAYFEPQLAANSAHLATTIGQLPLATRAAWDEEAWRLWQAPVDFNAAWIRYGTLREARDHAESTLPALAPFLGGNRTVIIRSSDQTFRAAESLLQSLLLRTALLLPHQASYLLLDPSGNGMAFPMLRALPSVVAQSTDLASDLDLHGVEPIKRINAMYLDATTTSFDRLSADVRSSERLKLIFAANFPQSYERRAIDRLHNIAATGPRAGVYLFIHYNQDYELPRDLGMDRFKNAFFIDLAQHVTTLGGVAYSVGYDGVPPISVHDHVLAVLSDAAPIERKLRWDEVVGLPSHQWWQGDSTKRISTPVGKRGNTDLLRVWFGEDKDDRPCVHGMVAAMAGAGKSSLYNTMIAGLAIRYSPAELRLYLIDGKFGVGFQPYRRLPHAEVVSLKTSAEMARSVLADLVAEMERRNVIFARSGVVGLIGYRAKGEPHGPMARLLLIIDEYQQLFEGDRDGMASLLLKRLSEQGRSAGIHMLLASQRFGAVGMLYQDAIFQNFHLRVAMKMPEDAIDALTAFRTRGKQLVRSTCTLPGKVVINDNAGEDSMNMAGKVAFLEDSQLTSLLDALELRAASFPAETLPQRVIFNGEAQPILSDNPYLRILLGLRAWPNAAELEALARRPQAEGGMGITDWFAAECPQITWLGQEFNVRGQAHIILRRRVAEHCALVGSTNTVRYGMLAAILTGLSATSTPGRLRFVVIDRSIPGSDWHETLPTMVSTLLRPAGFSVGLARDDQLAQRMLANLIEELDRRRSISESDREALPTMIVMMAEPDRISTFQRTVGPYGPADSSDSALIKRLLHEGSMLGIHLVMSFAGVRSLQSVLDEKQGLSQFRHRVALQMSDDESYLFVRSRKAAQLQLDGHLPICSLYMDMESDQAVRFKPYSIANGSGETMATQIAAIGSTLAQRGCDEHG